MKYKGIDCDFKKIKDYHHLVSSVKESENTMDLVNSGIIKKVKRDYAEYIKLKIQEFIKHKKNENIEDMYILFYTWYISSNNGSTISIIQGSKTAKNLEEVYKIKKILMKQNINCVDIIEYNPNLEMQESKDKDIEEELEEDIEDNDDDEYEEYDPEEAKWIKADELYDQIKNGDIDKGEVK